MSLTSITELNAAGGFLKPGDHVNDLALLVEPKRIDKNVPNTYKGVTKNRDEVTADVSVFATSEAVEKGEPTQVLQDVKIVHGMLTSALEKILGGATIGVIRKVPTKNGEGWAFRPASQNVEAAVTAYYTKREAAIEAALNSDDVPDFD